MCCQHGPLGPATYPATLSYPILLPPTTRLRNRRSRVRAGPFYNCPYFFLPTLIAFVYTLSHIRGPPHTRRVRQGLRHPVSIGTLPSTFFSEGQSFFFLPREQPGKALSITTAIHPHLFRPCPHGNDARETGIFRESGLSVASSGLLCQRLISICRTENEGTGKLIKRDYV